MPGCRSTTRAATPCWPRKTAADSPTRLPPTIRTGISSSCTSRRAVAAEPLGGHLRGQELGDRGDCVGRLEHRDAPDAGEDPDLRVRDQLRPSRRLADRVSRSASPQRSIVGAVIRCSHPGSFGRMALPGDTGDGRGLAVAVGEELGCRRRRLPAKMQVEDEVPDHLLVGDREDVGAGMLGDPQAQRGCEARGRRTRRVCSIANHAAR